jgi:asparagine synthase (glutamine-hydrolysing)
LDVELAEFLISVPYSLKLNKTQEKIIAKTAFPNLPKEITQRAKQGFGAPVDRWLAFEDVEALTLDILKNPNSKLYEFVNFTEVQKYVTKKNYQTWILLNLAVWFNSNI